MTDRLKDIWSRFEKVTSRSLTSSDVDNIPRPVVEEMHRRHDLGGGRSVEKMPMPEGVSAPAEQAFGALRSRLAGFDDKGRPSRRKVDPASDPNDNPQERMLRDLASTEQRIARREMDYKSWYAAREEERTRRPKRKKFLGIF